jgi:class 3 adenylate cyclase
LDVPASAREERKVVSVLFCDLVGFTSRSESMDVEDVRGTLQPYHALLRRELERHGGTVEKFIGDAVMAVFGAPAAHEDDPERAVRSALAIVDAVAELRERDPAMDLHVRIGVNTGETLIALGADPARGEGMASGDVVNTAARLESAAPADGVLVGEVTYRATSRVIRYEPADPVTAKGKSEPVPAWRAVEARSRFGIDVVQESRTPLVGRDDDMAALAAALERAIDRRAVQLVTLVGVPGIGKSRLVWELFRLVDARSELITWRQGRCLPYGDGVTYWALGEMLKSQAGMLDSDGAELAQQKLRAMVDG